MNTPGFWSQYHCPWWLLKLWPLKQHSKEQEIERGERTKGFLQLSEILLRGLTWKFHLIPLYLDQNIVTATPGLGKVFILGNNVSSKTFAKGKGGWNNGSQLAIFGDFFFLQVSSSLSALSSSHVTLTSVSSTSFKLLLPSSF